MKYVSLHHHTTFSIGDGYGTPENHAQRAAELGMGALAHTEHGNVSSHAQLEVAAGKAGIKPLYGVELYTANGQTQRKWHLTVLAETDAGYANLLALVSASYRNYYYWPTVTMPMLRAHSEGLIVLSGCADSKLACDLLGGKGAPPPDSPAQGFAASLRTARKFRDLLGDRYYLEVQAFPELERTRTLNPAYAAISAELGIPLVATCDVHYPNPADNVLQRALHTAHRGLGTVDVASAEWEYDVPLTLPDSDERLASRLVGTGLTTRQARGALAATGEIASRASVSLPRAPALSFPGVADPTAALWELLREGWRYRARTRPDFFAIDPEARRAQLRYEMDTIAAKTFGTYFLVLGDIVRWAKGEQIAVGPARGSAAASQVCYLLRITEVDSMAFPAMMVERFIDPARDDMPDVDLDFDPARAAEIEHYAVDKYGEANVGKVINYARYRGKSAVATIARVHDIPPWETSALRDRMLERVEGEVGEFDTITDTVEMFAEAAEVMAAHPELELAARLEGNLSGFGLHAAGLVVSTRPLTEVTALYTRTLDKGKPEQREVTTIAYDKRDAERLGLLKIDALKLSTMGLISDALRLAGRELEELYALELDDDKVMQAFRDGDVVGIFQWSGATTASINDQVAPERFMELADINALSRPGPLFSGAMDAYVAAKHSGQWSAPHPIVERWTAATYGQLVYQEQYLAIVRDLGGFSAREVGDIRRAIGKKKGVDEFNKLRDNFLSGAVISGADRATAESIWGSILLASRYAFNVAHSVSYAMLAYWTQWLKQYEPEAFYTAALRREEDKADVVRLVRDARRHRVDVRGLDLARSGTTWSLQESTVRAGWMQVDGIADKTAAAIAERGPFESWEQLLTVPGIGPKRLGQIRAAAEADDPAGVKALARRMAKIRHALGRNIAGLPLPSCTSVTFPRSKIDNVVWCGFVDKVNFIDEIEAERKRTGRPVEEIVAEMDSPELRISVKVLCHDDGDDVVTLRVNRWNYPLFADQLASLRNGDLVLGRGARRSGIYKTLHLSDLWVLDGMRL